MSENNEEEDDDNDRSIDDLTVDQEQRKQDIERVSFEWCEEIRKAGQTYRETGNIGDVASTLNLDTEEAKEAIIVYRMLLESPPEDVSYGAYSAGYRYYGLDESIEEIAGDDADSSKVEQMKDQIREFVGSVYRIHDPDEEDEIDEIPDEMPNNVFDVKIDFQDAFKGITALSDALDNLHQIDATIGVHQEAVDQVAESMSFQKDIRNISMLMESIPSVAAQFDIPNDAFAEIRAISTAFEDQIREPYSPDQQLSEVPEAEEEGTALEKIDKEEIEDLSNEQAIGYSLQLVVESLTKPNVGEWYLRQSEGMQKTVVRFVLFTTILILASGNVPLAVGGMTIAEPIVSDLIRGRLEEDSE